LPTDGPQTPSFAAPAACEQKSQESSQAVLQHRPSTQKPLSQFSTTSQELPSESFGTHRPLPSQK